MNICEPIQINKIHQLHINIPWKSTDGSYLTIVLMYWVCTNYSMLWDQQSLFSLQQCRDLCLTAAWCCTVKSRLIDFCGAIFLKDMVCTWGQILFYCFLQIPHLSVPCLHRTAHSHNLFNGKQPFRQEAPWPQRHQMNPYLGGRGKEKQLCCLNIIKAWLTPSP